jgi:ubiquinone/menaquinone biosynthesis C-methylase UbiE
MSVFERFRVCPWWLAYGFDNRLRLLFHNPEKILGPYVQEGMTVADIGCGMGYFSISMARMVGETGRVISADLQQEMLDVLEKRARRAGVARRIHLQRCEPDRIGIEQKVDFALTFWMIHEVPDTEGFLAQVFSTLKPTGRYLLVEPRIHVPLAQFEETLEQARRAGFKILDNPQVSLSRAALLGKSQ